jgi:hypothetical protein
MPSDTRPYFVPDPNSITWQTWNLVDSGVSIDLPDFIEGWQPGDDLQIARSFAIDLDAVERETRRTASDLVLVLSWASSTTGMRGSSPPASIPKSGIGTLEALLPGERIGGVLTLRSAVVLKHTDAGSAPLGSAHIPGSVMAEEHRSLVLEREGRMFPIHKVDFSRTPYAPDASWHLEVDGGLETPYLASLMLLINSRDTAMCRAIAGDLKNEPETLIYQNLEEGVASLLIELALRNRDELDSRSWPVDSVGDVLKRTLASTGLVDAATIFDTHPSDFRTAIAGAVRKSGHGRMFQ